MKSVSPILIVVIVVGSVIGVDGHDFQHLKMHHQICNYYDLTEFLAPICTAFYGRRYRRDAESPCKFSLL